MPEGSGRTNQPGNRVGSISSGRTNSAGNKDGMPAPAKRPTMTQHNTPSGRSLRPGNDTPGSIVNPSHGMGKGTVPSSGIPGRSHKFQQQGVKY